ncbi:hypothetical protein N431DRAFT_451357 [Stipitochalara longipes BDJ]|nr:hypothetical protein N431DRAFT_451357 [Stipitochalara longipes BDJ]
MLDTWSLVLESSFHGKEKMCIGARILKIQRLAIKIFLGALFYTDQIAYDAFIPDFRQIIVLSSSVLDDDERACGSDGGEGTKFSFELGVVPALAMTAWKCRDGVLRRQAIGLLDRAGIEGVWNGRAMAAVSRWVVEREEEEMGRDGFVAEEKRLKNIAYVKEVDAVGGMGVWSVKRGTEGVGSRIEGVVRWEG